MRRILTALAGGVLAVTLSAPPAHAVSDPKPVEHHSCHRGVVGLVLDRVIGWHRHHDDYDDDYDYDWDSGGDRCPHGVIGTLIEHLW